MSDLAMLEAAERSDRVEFMHAGELIGTLAWIGETSGVHPRAGWWLLIAGEPDEQIYRVPFALTDTPELARERGRSMSIQLAQQMLLSRIQGHLGPQ